MQKWEFQRCEYGAEKFYIFSLGENITIDTPELDNIIENWEEIKNVITKGTDDIVLIEVYEGVEVVRENEMAKLPQENVIQGIRYRHVDNSFEIMSFKKPFTIESLPEPLRKLVASKFNNYLPNAKYSYIGFIEENSRSAYP